MEKLVRLPAPQWLTENWQQWGEEWQQKVRDPLRKNDFSWRKSKAHALLIAVLRKMTQNHCSFCDNGSSLNQYIDSIEHFRPKVAYPLQAYHWDNLFLCCYQCQKKGTKFDELLLKPDDDNYQFCHFFDIEWETGQLIANPTASVADQQRANKTIELYRLNAAGLPEARKYELEYYGDLKTHDTTNKYHIDQFAFRFFLKRGYLPPLAG